MTPIAKAWPTEVGQEVTSLGIQVHGGMGYVEETGAAQYYRDVRIALHLRRHQCDPGDRPRRPQAAARRWRARYRRSYPRCASRTRRSRMRATTSRRSARRWRAGSTKLVLCSTYLLTGEKKDPELVSSAAYNYLMLLGTVIGGWQLARGALAAVAELGAPGADRVVSRDAGAACEVLCRAGDAARLCARRRRARGQRLDHGARRRELLSRRG